MRRESWLYATIYRPPIVAVTPRSHSLPSERSERGKSGQQPRPVLHPNHPACHTQMTVIKHHHADDPYTNQHPRDLTQNRRNLSQKAPDCGWRLQHVPARIELTLSFPMQSILKGEVI